VLLAIPVISYYGRSLQHFLTDWIGVPGIVWLLGGVTGLLILAAGVLLLRRLGFRGLLHLLWMGLLAGGLMYYLRTHPERWYHIPLFGLLGYLSVSLFSVRTGTEIALAWAVLDELFQDYLPDRVGDFEDVLVNAVCAGAGIILYIILNREKLKNPFNRQV